MTHFSQGGDTPGPGAPPRLQPRGPGGEAARVPGEQAGAPLPVLSLAGRHPHPPPPVAPEHAAGVVSPGDLAPSSGHHPGIGD